MCYFFVGGFDLFVVFVSVWEEVRVFFELVDVIGVILWLDGLVFVDLVVCVCYEVCGCELVMVVVDVVWLVLVLIVVCCEIEFFLELNYVVLYNV